MRIYLGELEFPAAPEEFLVEEEGNWAEEELESVGQVLLYRPPKLRRVKFSGIFPAERMGFVQVENLRPPAEYCRMASALAEAKAPSRLVVSGGAEAFSMLAVVERFDRWEQAGEAGDIYFRITLREYREFGKKAIVQKVEGPGQERVSVISSRAGEPEIPQSYMVKKGDTLWAIAKRYLGSGSRYPELAAKNGIKNANLIYPGQVIVIS